MTQRLNIERPASPEAAARHRVAWIDTLRVVAVLLVVAGHSMYGAGSTAFGALRGSVPEAFGPVYKFLCDCVLAIYSFHMPLFFAISGMCLGLSSSDAVSWSALVKRKFFRLVVPMLLTGLLLSLPLRYLGGYYDGKPLAVMLLHNTIFPYELHLWFLPALFLCFIAQRLVEPLHRRSRFAYWALLLVASYAGHAAHVPASEFLGIPGALKHLLYFCVGYHAIPYLKEHTPQLWATILSIAGQLALLAAYHELLKDKPYTYGVTVLLSLWGSYNVAALCILVSRRASQAARDVHRRMAERSYDIYLYSDPFNYLLLPLLFAIPGFDFYGNGAHTIAAVGARFAFQIVMALGVSVIVGKLRRAFRPSIQNARLPID